MPVVPQAVQGPRGAGRVDAGAGGGEQPRGLPVGRPGAACFRVEVGDRHGSGGAFGGQAQRPGGAGPDDAGQQPCGAGGPEHGFPVPALARDDALP